MFKQAMGMVILLVSCWIISDLIGFTSEMKKIKAETDTT